MVEKKRTKWLGEQKYPNADSALALSTAFYYLTKFRPDLAKFDIESFRDRLALLFWWESGGFNDYPGLEWNLRPQEVESLKDFSVSDFMLRFPDIEHSLMQSEGPMLNNHFNFIDGEYLIESHAFQINTTRSLPTFLHLIWTCRSDVHQLFDISTEYGYLSLLAWWTGRGHKEYPRILWLPKKENLVGFGEMNWPQAGERVALPAFLGVLWEASEDLQLLCEPTEYGRMQLLHWWHETGQHEYAFIDWSLSHTPDLNEYLNEMQNYALSTKDALLPLPYFMQLIWDNRSELQSSFEISQAYGRFGMCSWWQRRGNEEYTPLSWQPGPEALEGLLALNWPQAGERCALPAFLGVLREAREDLRLLCDTTEYGRLQLLHWWHETGQAEYAFIDWSLSQCHELNNYFSETSEETVLGRRNISNLLRIIWHGRSDLRAAFDQTNVSAQLALTEWWEQSGESQYSTFSRLHFSELKNETETGLLQTNLFANASSTAPELQDHLSSQTGSILEKPPGDIEYLTVLDQPTTMMPMVEPITQIGMNLIGFARGVLGLGEDIRMATMACQQAAIPIAVIDAPIPGPVKEDDTLNELLVEDLRYPISVFFMPPTEMIRWAMQGGVDLINTEAYNIGAWPWELPYWPEEFGQVHELVDEIWAQSKFVASVFQRITDKPVTYMPMAVAIPAPLNYSRDRFNFPKSDFLFFMMFDGNSWLSRKNPLAGVQAFVKAFPLNTSGVGLVIKAMNINTVDTQWQALLSMVANDPRVIIVNDKMPRQDSIDLMACCDAYISLHRSEGFGRVIAEAMLLGKPTIATNFSGNIDFCNTSTSYLVDGELVPLQKGDYLFFEGQYWCDPDVNIASERMLQLFEDKSKRERIALAGKHYIEEHHSIAAVSRAYAIRLGEIESKLERLI